MIWNNIFIFLIYIVSLIVVVILHEYIHWIFAKIFNRHPSVTISKFFTASIQYQNNGKDFENLVIAASPGLILPLFSFIIPQNNLYFIMIKIFSFLNFLNLLPLTADGEVILLSLLNIIMPRKKK